MIRDSFCDLRDDTGTVVFQGWRCVNCGEVVDAVVLAHRRNHPEGPYRGKTRDRRGWERLAVV
ncbi:hypothetical protein [Nitrospira lenta]|nr:hypothetical protein [Nitrospira lenta]